MGPFGLWSLIKGKTLYMLTEKRIVYLKVSHTLRPPPSPLYRVPFSDYNHNQEDSSFGIKGKKYPLGPTSAKSTCHAYDSIDNFPIK